MSPIKIRIAAKTDVGLERTNNEDNFQVASDLSSGQMRWVNNEICSLGDKGTLLVVADGMGGMNAGEVASELAINAVREAFSSDKLTADVMKNRFSIEKFMNTVIINADADIKAYARKNPESRGMGTTIVIAWLLDNKLYVSWCGDSRAYVYNPQAGLHQISKDHSFVQSLVDKGAIDQEDAFDYPDSNIVTRSLGDSSTKAKPESLLKPYELCDNDIILLCTDGLSGMIRNSEMENVIRANEHNMDLCADELIRAACAAEGSDNITVCMCQILQGAGICNPQVFEEYDKRLAGPQGNKGFSTKIITVDDKGKRKIWMLCAFIILVVGVFSGMFMHNKFYPPKEDIAVADSDSVVNDKKDTCRIYVISASNGVKFFTLERKSGNPQDGDKAYPDGKYELNGDSIVEVKGNVVYITIKNNKKTDGQKSITDETTTKKTGASGKEKGGKKNKSVLKGTEDKGGKSSANEDKLTKASNSADVKQQMIETEHEVKEKETLYSIAAQYGISPEDIKKLNPQVKEKALKPGDKLKIKYVKIKK